MYLGPTLGPTFLTELKNTHLTNRNYVYLL